MTTLKVLLWSIFMAIVLYLLIEKPIRVLNATLITPKFRRIEKEEEELYTNRAVSSYEMLPE